MASMPLTSSAAPQQASARDQATTKQRSLPVFDWTIARLMAVLATIMLPTGLVAIILGWWGAAHTPFVFEQIPYLISGGLLGIGLMAAGGLLYLGSWLARLAEQQREEGAKFREALMGIRQEIEYLPGLVSGGESRTTEQTYVATRTGTMFHVAECTVVQGRSDLRDVSADDGLDPCKICQPTAAA
jgi:hypothetical protein